MGNQVVSVCAETVDMEGILATLADRIGPQKFNAWFRHGTHIHLHDGHIRVNVPNPFVANWIEGHYRADIAAAVEIQTGRIMPVAISVDPTLSTELRKRQLDSQAEIVNKAAEGRTRLRRPVEHQPLRHKLDDFVVGGSNRMAFTSAVAMAGETGTPFNSLFIHGPCGVGKTHLLQGVCDLASRRSRSDRPMTWRYVTGEQFTNEFISAMRKGKLEDFRGRFRRLDLLAIDDVHFLSAKKATQEEFLHTFNAIYSAGKQVVMASDAHPHLVGELNEQLVSRFVAGMVVKIDAPDQPTRMEIIRRKAGALGLTIPPEVMEFVAMHVRGSVRELEGTLVKLQAVASLDGGRITLTMATRALSDHLARTDSAVTLGDIEAAVATYFGITPADLHSSRRTRTVSAARMVCMHLARRHTQMSFPEIGRFMGKNHSSVVLACQRLDALLAQNAELTWMSPMGPRAMPAGKLIELLTQQIA